MCNRRVSSAWSITLPSTTKLVFVHVCDRANKDDGAAYLLIQTVAKACDLSDRAVQKALAMLESKGLVVRDVRPGRSSVFTVPDPMDWPSVEADPRTTFTPEPHSPPNDVHPRTTFTPEGGSPTPEQCSPTPERGSPITVIQPSPNPTGDGAGEQVSGQGRNVIAPHVAAAKAMIAAGIPRHEINHQHADLVELAAIVPLREFELAAGQASADGKGFAYALGIVKRRAAEKSRDPPQGRSRSNVPANNADFKSQTYAGSSIDQLPDAVRALVEQQLGDRAGATAL